MLHRQTPWTVKQGEPEAMNSAEENPKHVPIQVEGLFCNMGLRDSCIRKQMFITGTAQVSSHIS